MVVGIRDMVLKGEEKLKDLIAHWEVQSTGLGDWLEVGDERDGGNYDS